MPRWAGPPIWIPLVALFYGVLPWALSLVDVRYGWTGSAPGVANMSGIAAVATGFSFLVWALGHHYASASRGWEMSPTPGYLIVRGPYRYTRNPMYFGGAAIWFGWAIFYGSASIVAVFLVFVAGLNFGLIPWEERSLERAFGDSYRQYRDAVPRWIPRLHASQAIQRTPSRPPRVP